MLQKIGKYGLKLCYGILSIASFYYLCCLVLPLVEVNGDYLVKNKGLLVFVAGDGMHSEVIVPVKNEQINWETFINRADFNATDQEWLSFGFAENKFYQQNKRWDNMNYLTGFSSLCGFGQSVMHVSYEGQYPFNRKFIRKIYLSPEQYLQLCSFIKNSFAQNNGQMLTPFNTTKQGEVTYEAQREFSFFHTCNTWTNNALKVIGYRTGKWTALEGGIREQFSGN
ncbi:MAG: DUF2459 domain-containing protein [Bacteroidota bacterium]